ncbi:hypothetical protein A9G34_08250 [Gilliamella sp. Choc4-2]|jgi:SH3 domain protein|uniref:TIGR04211 family SH3 domain-containing protein n=1 Tax=unclassified Gilliamella TaxID=2685620 RepID=UPI0004DD4C57|nr:TIGR04211 family SH3 domain-containing protein [Gilliamella apicola]KFA59661.1 SH3 domain protein [Gilliamella apicola]OCG30065.1 hypothetical protein A9G33_09410 [Gilliamella apicola]OCG43583.1 hypothetical protein A9G34_08250 [Gilliamella apicola]OCG53538.1 hypothetical protein A9G36_01765 [Gilliamella apicola]OCG64483.1 hypothetical protein A9G48_02270 [Gilliamella apicola]
MKKQNIITLFSFIMLASNANAVDKYVADEVDVYLRRGPSQQHAILYTVKSGAKVTELEKSPDGKYTRIKLNSGKVAWIETNKLNDYPSYKERIPVLEAKIAEYKDKVDNAEDYHQKMISDYVEKLQTSEKLIENLQNKNNELERKFKEQEVQLDSALNQVDDKRRDLIITWFTYGGLVAGGGFLLGLILPNIMPRRRKKDRWMH